MAKYKTKTIKIDLQNKEGMVIMVYEAPAYEDKQSIGYMLEGVIKKGKIKVGEKIEAWKFYDTSCSYRLTKSINNHTFHFHAC